jgi:hypothetical protein
MITSTEFIAYSFVAIIVLVFAYWFTRFVMDIQKRNRHLEAQTELLGKMAEKLGVSHQEVFGIVNAARRPG